MSAPTWSPVYPAEIAADHSWGPLAGPSVMIGEMAARIFVAGLYLLLVQSVLTEFLRTGRMTALPLMISELLVVVFTLLRRRATLIDRSAISMAVTIVSSIGPLLVRAGGDSSAVSDLVTTIVSTA